MSRDPGSVHVLLVNPWIADFKAFDLWMKPMGLLYIAAVLRKNGFNVHLLDCLDRNHPSVTEKKKLRPNMTGKFYHEIIPTPEVFGEIPRRFKRYGIPISAFHETLDSLPRPHVILVTSMMTYWYPGPHEAIALLKQKYPDTPVILGGIYATLSNAFANSYSGADIVAAGYDMPNLLNLIANLTYAKSSFKPSSFREFPFPEFSLYLKPDYCCLLTSIGCPYRCAYCASKKLQPHFETRTPESVVSEIIERVENQGIRHIAFYDDALFFNKDKHIVPILNEVFNRNLPVTFHSPNGLHARFIDPGLAWLMKMAGFSTVRLSLESVGIETQAAGSNKVTNKELVTAVENLLKAGFTAEDIGIYIMMGIPGQTFNEVEQTIDFVYSLGVQNRISTFSPIPFTPAFEKFRQELSLDPGFHGAPDDPLYQNNTYQFYAGRWLDLNRRIYLQDKARRLNREILEKIDREKAAEETPGIQKGDSDDE